MADVFDSMIATIDAHHEAVSKEDFYFFEPWNVSERDQRQIDLAKKDGVDLHDPNFVSTYGKDPHEFQTGIMTSDAFLNITIAGTQSGKSFAELVRLLCCTTGEFPYSFRYDKGVDTGIKRKISEDNVKRFGRRRPDGSIIDYDKDKMDEGGDWDCGNIIGAGKFPKKLLFKDGDKVWIGTTRKAFDEMWWPKLNIHEKNNCVIPSHFIDKTRGTAGYSVTKGMVHFVRGITFSFITYESNYVALEATKVRRVVLDEEPPKKEIFTAAQEHAESIAIITTPYRGITWLKSIMEWKAGVGHKRIHHCTQYDSPYQNNEDVDVKRGSYSSHERAARTWGVAVTQNQQTPVFDSLKINLWMQRYRPMYDLATFVPSQQWARIINDGTSIMPSLLDVSVRHKPAEEEDHRYVWRIYEEPRRGVGYVLPADLSAGVEEISGRGEGRKAEKDLSAAYIMRPADKENNEKWPKVCAQIRSTLPVLEFARMSVMVARCYNNALLAPEGARVAGANSAYITEVRDWPWWYLHASTSNATRTAQRTKGFDTNSSTRSQIYKLIEDWVESFTAEECPTYYDEQLLTELAEAIYNKNGRPDHPAGKHNDLLVAYGIGLYVLTYAAEQCRCNDNEEVEEEEVSFMERLRSKNKGPDMAGYNLHYFR